MIRLGIAEILKYVSEVNDYSLKVNILRKNESAVLKHLLQLAFTPGVEWLLPPGKPPIKYNDLPGQQGNLFAQWRIFYLFFPGGNNNLKQSKREFLFVQMLESLDPKDADLICNIKDGMMPYDSVTPKLVNDAFPGLLPPEAVTLPAPVAVAPKPVDAVKTKLPEVGIPVTIQNLSADDIALIKSMGIEIPVIVPVADTTEPVVAVKPKTTTKKKAPNKVNG